MPSSADSANNAAICSSPRATRLPGASINPPRFRNGYAGTPDPAFRGDFNATLFAPSDVADTDLHPETFAGGPSQGCVVVLGARPVTVDIRPGSYELLATRGCEDAVQRALIKVRRGSASVSPSACGG